MEGNLRLIQYCSEFRPVKEVNSIPPGLGLRGIYVLFHQEGKFYNVVYVGIAAKDSASIRSRLKRHAKDKKKTGWTHYSFYKVWPNITEQEIRELEGLFLQIYRKDRQAHVFNRVKRYSPILKRRVQDIGKYKEEVINLENVMRSFPNKKNTRRIK